MRKQMTLTERLHRLNARRDELIGRVKRKAGQHQSTASDHTDLVRETCKVLKLEVKMEKAS